MIQQVEAIARAWCTALADLQALDGAVRVLRFYDVNHTPRLLLESLDDFDALAHGEIRAEANAEPNGFLYIHLYSHLPSGTEITYCDVFIGDYGREDELQRLRQYWS